MTTTAPDSLKVGALRSRLVSKLTGLSVPTLRHWHSSELQEATYEPGDRGVPRIYSWLDYQRLCVMASLKGQGVPTTRIRAAVMFLDQLYPEWWSLSLSRYDGSVDGSQATIHVVVRDNVDVVADVAGGQTSFRELLEFDTDDTSDSLACALANIQTLGPLFRLHRFDDAVWMRPDVNAGLPTILGTSLETDFVVTYAARTSVEEAARTYGLEPARILRARDFEEAA